MSDHLPSHEGMNLFCLTQEEIKETLSFYSLLLLHCLNRVLFVDCRIQSELRSLDQCEDDGLFLSYQLRSQIFELQWRVLSEEDRSRSVSSGVRFINCALWWWCISHPPLALPLHVVKRKTESPSAHMCCSTP